MILQVVSFRARPYTKKGEVAPSVSVALVARQCKKGAVYQGHNDYASCLQRGCFMNTLSFKDERTNGG